jgi:hypothetical protein
MGVRGTDFDVTGPSKVNDMRVREEEVKVKRSEMGVVLAFVVPRNPPMAAITLLAVAQP